MKIQQRRLCWELFYTWCRFENGIMRSYFLCNCTWQGNWACTLDLLTIKLCNMKKVLVIAAVVMSLAACNNSGSDSETNADTAATRYDTSGSTLDTSAYNSGDSTGINRDTSRTDRTDVRKRTDTGSRRSDTLR